MMGKKKIKEKTIRKRSKLGNGNKEQSTLKKKKKKDD